MPLQYSARLTLHYFSFARDIANSAYYFAEAGRLAEEDYEPTGESHYMLYYM
jgi:hypothetical protein